MSGLFSTLSSATRSLEAQRYGLEVTGQNIANVNTPGYARREALLESVPPPDLQSAGGGVDVVGVRATRDRLLERRLQMERPAEQRDAAIADSLSVVEVAVGQPGDSIDASLNAFFDAAASLAEDPTSSTTRQLVIMSGQNLASAFSDMAGRLVNERQSADLQIRGALDEVNTLTSRFAALNLALSQAPQNGAASMQVRDEQKNVLDQLSKLVDVQAIERSDGVTDLAVGGGRALVIGSSAFDLTASPQPPEGLVAVTSAGQDITAAIAGGRLGGYLQVRDVLIPDYQDRLDALAYQVAVEVNAVHAAPAAAFDLQGNQGGDFFVAPAAVAGAAAAMAVDPTLAADSDLVAAAGVAATGDNQAARALANLRDARVMNGGQTTFVNAWAQLVYRVGSDTQAARQEQQSRSEIVQQVEALTDAVSGVSLDEEAMMMLRYQRAYEANARFFQVVDQSIATLIEMLGN